MIESNEKLREKLSGVYIFIVLFPFFYCCFRCCYSQDYAMKAVEKKKVYMQLKIKRCINFVRNTPFLIRQIFALMWND